MSAIQKLKAYFGMVPVDEYDDDEGYDPSYGDADYSRREAPVERGGYSDAPSSPSRYRANDDVRSIDDLSSRSRNRPALEPSHSLTHGALAVDRAPEPIARLRSTPASIGASIGNGLGADVDSVRAPMRDALSRIITLHPTNYVEARAIGEAYRAGTPVIMNLTEMDNADAKRLVDFAAGLAFALRGSMDKVTNKVFLLSPPDVDVTAEDRRRIAEGGLFLRG